MVFEISRKPFARPRVQCQRHAQCMAVPNAMCEQSPMKLISLATITLLLLTPPAPAADNPPAEKPIELLKPKVEETRELLADHQTIAKLKEVKFRRCMGLTSLCPDRCGQSGNFADFDIVTYLKYTKLGEYGDPKTTNFMIQIDDNMKNMKVSKELAETARALKPGDTVLLSWRHDYVTRKEEGGESKFPDRPVTKLEKITKEEAEKLAEKKGK